MRLSDIAKMTFPPATFDTEKQASANIVEMDRLLENFFKENGYDFAFIIQSILKQATAGKYRRSGNIPERKHMYDQVYYTLSLMQSGIRVPDPERTIALQLGHDLVEKVFPTFKDLEKAVQEKMVSSAENKRRLENFLEDVDMLTYTFKGNKDPRFENRLTGFHRRIVLEGSASAAFVRGTDTIQNTATLIGMPDMTPSKQAEELDQKSIFLLHPVYPDNDSKLRSYRRVLGQRFPEHYKAFNSLRDMVQNLIFINRVFHECLPEMSEKRQHKKTGLKVEDLDHLDPDDGFEHLPEGIHPMGIAKARIACALHNEHEALEADRKKSIMNWVGRILPSLSL